MVVTAWVMTVSTIQLFVGVVLAATLIEDLGITRWQIGLLGAVNTGVGALVAPSLGRLADRLGARRSAVLVVIVSAAALVSTAAALTYWMLVAASMLAGLPQGAGNPVTNKLIAEEVPPQAQGAVTGVKQSGVQFAVFLSGLMLPASSTTIGWRWAVTGFAAFTLLTAAVIHFRFPSDRLIAPRSADLQRPGPRPGPSPSPVETPPLSRPNRRDQNETDREAVGRFVAIVAVYSFLLGMVAGGITRFYPLFSQEVLGFSETTAGLAVSVTGLTAIAARLIWGTITDRLISSHRSLRLLAVGASLTALLLLAAEWLASWLLWPAVVLAAFTVVAWNVVAMLAVIRSVRPEESGRSTGIVLAGFLGGLTISAPLAGLAVDRLGSYQPVWVALCLVSLSGALVMRSPRTRR
ncbi:MAG: MFS transporter [Acidimicrobiales bacterium]